MIYLRTLLASIILLLVACDGGEHEASEGATTSKSDNALVVVSNYPLYFFASQIADGVDDAPQIVFPDIDGDPTFWIPDAEQIQQLQSADIVLLNGAGAEPWLNLISLDKRRVRDTTASAADRLIPLNDSAKHQHGPEGEHSHQGTAFTTWLDPTLAIAQAQSVAESLIELAPAGEASFRDNLAKLEQELMELDAEFAEVFAALDGRPVLFSHPVYQYLEHRYNINGESLHWEPEEELSTSAWIALQQIRGKHPATMMFWEAEPLDSTDQRLAALGIASVPLQTVANSPDEGDYITAMRANIERIASTL
jgi:zinc transport system substrate-binding protein